MAGQQPQESGLQSMLIVHAKSDHRRPSHRRAPENSHSVAGSTCSEMHVPDITTRVEKGDYRVALRIDRVRRLRLPSIARRAGKRQVCEAIIAATGTRMDMLDLESIW